VPQAPESPRPVGSPREAADDLLAQLVSLSRRSRSFSTAVAHRCGLQPSQIHLLFSLYRATECRVAALAEQQLVDPSVASRQIAGLEREGLLGRRPDPEDGRASLVSLTDAGLARLEQVRELHMGAMAQAVAGWPAERIYRMAHDLEELIGNAEHAYQALSGPEPVDDPGASRAAANLSGDQPANELKKELS
ncbi:MarR family transcriptional regulator, partial [Georgenia ruanii]|nr:MarR family transcriptional regulator [Georgenia ruanii]